MLRGQWFSRASWTLLLLLLCVCTTAQATTLRRLSLRDLVRRSDATVLGRATSRQSAWEGTRIMTRIQVEVDEVWAHKKNIPSQIEVVVPGGVVGELGQRVDGAAVVPSHGRVVLHLHQVAQAFVPAGMAQGVWWVDSLAGEGGHVRRGPSDRLVMGLGQADVGALPGTLAELKERVLEASRAP